MKIQINEQVVYEGPTWKLIFWFCLAAFLSGMVNRAIELIFE